jgi:hypothetical protein
MSPYIKQICIFFKEQFTVKGFKNTSCRENTQRAAGDAIYQWNYNGRSRKYIYQEVTSSDKVTDLYSEGNPFESRSGHQLSSQFSWIYSDTLVKFFYRNLLDAGGFSHTLSHSIILPSVTIIRRYVTWHTQESLRQLGLQILKKNTNPSFRYIWRQSWDQEPSSYSFLMRNYIPEHDFKTAVSTSWLAEPLE